MAPYPAAVAAMGEISGAVVATSLVLLAVFIPVAFFPGSTGLLYKQFAITIACSIAISLFTALTLAPTLSAQLLGDGERPVHGRIFRLIATAIAGTRAFYHRVLPMLLRRRTLVLAIFGAALLLTAFTYATTPIAFIPDEDQGYLIVVLQAPVGTSADLKSHASRVASASSTGCAGGRRCVHRQRIRLYRKCAESRHHVPSAQTMVRAPRAGPRFSRDSGPLRTVHHAAESDAQVLPLNPPSVQGVGNCGRVPVPGPRVEIHRAFATDVGRRLHLLVPRTPIRALPACLRVPQHPADQPRNRSREGGITGHSGRYVSQTLSTMMGRNT